MSKHIVSLEDALLRMEHRALKAEADARADREIIASLRSELAKEKAARETRELEWMKALADARVELAAERAARAEDNKRNDEHHAAAMSMSEKHRRSWVEACQELAAERRRAERAEATVTQLRAALPTEPETFTEKLNAAMTRTVRHYESESVPCLRCGDLLGEDGECPNAAVHADQQPTATGESEDESFQSILERAVLKSTMRRDATEETVPPCAFPGCNRLAWLDANKGFCAKHADAPTPETAPKGEDE